MENGTVIWKDEEGRMWAGVVDHENFYPNFTSGLIGYKHKEVLDKAEITKEELMELISNSIKEDK